jgi:CBS domain containing-hemolysin-like protein
LGFARIIAFPEAFRDTAGGMLTWETAALVIVFGAAASFLCALAEAALFSLGRWRVQQLAESSPPASRLQKLLEEPHEVLAAIVLGNTFANGAMIASVLWLSLKREYPVMLLMAAVFIFILLACEVLPKAFGVRAPEFWALRLVRPVELLTKYSRPARRLADLIESLVLRAIPKNFQPQPYLSDQEYQDLLEIAWQQGTLARTEKEIILQIIGMERQTAGDVMKPRATMACIPDDLSVEEMIEAARQHKHSRLPMYDETPDTIVGILNTRALLLDPNIDLSEAIEFPSFVPATMNLLQLFQALQRQRRGLAIVLDEFGGTAGLVTVHDILEQVIGKIRRDADARGNVLEKQGPGKWRVSGATSIEDFRREYPELGEIPDVDTMGGLLVRELEVVPANGQSATFRGLRLTAQAVDDRRVHELLVETVRRA